MKLPGKQTWCQFDAVFSVGPKLFQLLVTAEPKGAFGITDEDFVVLTCGELSLMLQAAKLHCGN